MENLDYYNRNYKRQKKAGVTIGEKMVCPDKPNGLEEAVFVSERTLYLGHFHTSHYGNFLFDDLCRLWYLVDNQGGIIEKFAYTSNGFDLCDKLSFLHILSYFEITPGNLLRITLPTRFKSLIEPEPSFVHDKYFTLDHIGIYDYIKSKINTLKYPTFNKVYFTRTRLKRHKEVGEKIFEEFFRMNGFTVLAPESLSFEEQVMVVSNCSILASIEGTLAHNIVFADRSDPNLRQLILKKQSYIIPRQFMINQAIGVPAEYIEVYKEPFKGFPINYDRGPFLLCWNKNICDFASREGMKVPDVSYAEQTLNYIEYSYKCIYYLFKHLCKKVFRWLKQF